MFPRRVPCTFFNWMIQWIYCEERWTLITLNLGNTLSKIYLHKHISVVVQNSVQRWRGLFISCGNSSRLLNETEIQSLSYTVEHYFSPKYTILHPSTLKIHYKRTFKKLRRWHITLMPLSEILGKRFVCMSIIVCRRVCRFASQLIPSSWMHLR